MNAHKTRLARLKQALKAVTQSAGQRCQCTPNRWLCSEGELPPTHCPTCGGIDPPGLFLVLEVVEVGLGAGADDAVMEGV
jgi:hypothetical protein